MSGGNKYSRVNPIIKVIYFFSKIFGIEIKLPLFVCFAEFVELGVKHSDDFARFVVDNGFLLLVPQDGHRVPTIVL